LDADYEFYVTGLNPVEGTPSGKSSYRVAGFPDPPGAITEISNSLTGDSIGLTWEPSANNGGSAIVAFTLVKV